MGPTPKFCLLSAAIERFPTSVSRERSFFEVATKTVKEDNSQRVPLKGGRLSIHLFGAQSIFVQGRSNLGLEKEKRKKKRRRRRRGGDRAKSVKSSLRAFCSVTQHTLPRRGSRLLTCLLAYLLAGGSEGGSAEKERRRAIYPIIGKKRIRSGAGKVLRRDGVTDWTCF